MEELTEYVSSQEDQEGYEKQKEEESKKRKRAPQQLQKDLNGKKMCNECQITKPISEFYIFKKNDNIGFTICCICKDCDKKRRRIFRANNRYRLLYNISNEEVRNMLEEQLGVCQICSKYINLGERDETSKRTLTKSTAVVDHNHETGQVRGLLCANCNTAIGLLKDSPEFCRNAANYLEKHAKKTSIVENNI